MFEVVLWDYDRVGASDHLGTVVVPLGDLVAGIKEGTEGERGERGRGKRRGRRDWGRGVRRRRTRTRNYVNNHPRTSR